MNVYCQILLLNEREITATHTHTEAQSDKWGGGIMCTAPLLNNAEEINRHMPCSSALWRCSAGRLSVTLSLSTTTTTTSKSEKGDLLNNQSDA